MAHTVFICHSSKDKLVADAACAALEARRIPCWIAPRDVLGGTEYMEELDVALANSQIVLLIFSQKANDSPQVRREIERSVSYEKIILPFRIEDALPTRAMKFALSNTHWLDAINPPMERRLSDLCDTVLRLIERKAADVPLWQQIETIVEGATEIPEAVPKATEPIKPTEPKSEPISERIPEQISEQVTVETSDSVITKLKTDSRRFPRWGWGALASLVLVAAVAAAMFFLLPRPLRTLQGHGGSVYSVAFSSDGHTLASGTEDKTIELWDVSNAQLVRTLRDHTGGVDSVTFSPDGHTLASGSYDRTIKLWDVASGRLSRTLQGHTGYVYSVAFSPDGRTLASGGADNTIKFWDVTSGQLLRTLQGKTNDPVTDAIRSVAYSPDGRTLASGSNDRTVELWDIAGGKLLSTLQAHAGVVWCVAFDPDGHTLASGGDDKTIKLWDVANGQNLQVLKDEDTTGFHSVAFSPDGRTLASAS